MNGRPVLATTAAKDMELVSEAEAVSTLGKAIYMKSERKSKIQLASACRILNTLANRVFFLTLCTFYAKDKNI